MVYVSSMMLGSYPPYGITGTFAKERESIQVKIDSRPPAGVECCCTTSPKIEFPLVVDERVLAKLEQEISASEYPFIGGPFHGTKDFLDPKTEVCDKAFTQTYRPCLEDREIEALTGRDPHWYPPGPTRVTYRYLRKTLQHNGRNYEVFGYAPMDLKRFARKAAKLAEAGLL